MTTPIPPDSSATRFVLSAQISPSPPDETPGLELSRDMSDADMEQFRADAALIRSVATMTPYARAFTAYRQLTALLDELVLEAQRPTKRGVNQLRRALAAVSHAFGELPTGLSDALVRRLGQESEADRRLDEAITEFVNAPAVRQVFALHDVAADQLVVVDVGGQRELVLPSDEPVGILATVEDGIALAGQLLSRWLLMQRDIIDAASQRIAAMDGEMFRGASVVVEMQTAPSERGEARIVGLTPVPLGEMYTAQDALTRAERTLEDSDREPALRGARAMTAEQIAAIAVVDASTDEVDEPPGPDERDRAIEFEALVAHLHLGVVRLERAWSRTLVEDDIRAMVAEWESLLHALVGQAEHDDRHLAETERHFELPPSPEAILELETRPGTDVANRQARLAHTMVISDLAALVPALRTPTVSLTNQVGQRMSWFSSGAFTMARDQLRLITDLAGMARPGPEALRPLELAERADLRADPEATLVHLARALKVLDPAQLPAAGSEENALADRVTELAARIGAGDRLDHGAITLIAHAARDVIREIVVTALAQEVSP